MTRTEWLALVPGDRIVRKDGTRATVDYHRMGTNLLLQWWVIFDGQEAEGPHLALYPSEWTREQQHAAEAA